MNEEDRLRREAFLRVMEVNRVLCARLRLHCLVLGLDPVKEGPKHLTLRFSHLLNGQPKIVISL